MIDITSAKLTPKTMRINTSYQKSIERNNNTPQPQSMDQAIGGLMKEQKNRHNMNQFKLSRHKSKVMPIDSLPQFNSADHTFELSDQSSVHANIGYSSAMGGGTHNNFRAPTNLSMGGMGLEADIEKIERDYVTACR